MSEKFWEHKQLHEMTHQEWESLCDGCGRCCLVTLEDEDTDELACTNIACKQLDISKVRCKSYQKRSEIVPTCLTLDIETLKKSLRFVPSTCAYRLIQEGKPLFDWHPLISGSSEQIIDAGISVKNKVISEEGVNEDLMHEYIVDSKSLV